MISEAEMREQFVAGYDFPPLVISLIRDVQEAQDEGVDAFFEAKADGRTFEFAAEFKSRNSPRIFEEALPRIENAARRQGLHPMLVVPYLPETQLYELQRRKLSGIDLSGNGVITIPGELLVYRTGKPNKFPDSAPTKYAYRGATSLVARVFLCRKAFRSLADIEREIDVRGGNVVLSTISKALKRMESDLIVDRSADETRVRQPDKLLEKLAESYSEPKVSKTLTLAIKGFDPVARGSALMSKRTWETFLAQTSSNSPLALSGRSSIDAYAVMGRQEWPVIYTQSIDRLVTIWGNNVEETSRFIDLELRQTDDPTVYFDVRMKENLPYASPVQVFLECSAGDKRERETALHVKDLILRELRE